MFGADEDIHTEHRYFGPSLKDALQAPSVCMSRITASKCLLCYIPSYVQIA